MATGLLHFGLSALISLVMASMLFVNMTVIYCIIRGKLYSASKNPLYAILLYNICCGTIQNITHIVFLLPMIALQVSFLKENPFIPMNSPLGVFLAFWFLHLWYNAGYIHLVMAVNRVSAICSRRVNAWFTVRNIICILVVISSMGIATSLYTQYYSPCCRIYFEPLTYGYMYGPNHGAKELSYNYSENWVEVPLDATVSTICVISYGYVFIYIYRMKRKVSINDKSRRQEIMCCVQCFLMFTFYSFTWISFQVMPRLGFTTLEPFAFTTIVYNIDCGINSIVLIINNDEIRRQLKHALRRVTKSSHYENSETTKRDTKIDSNV